MSLSSCFSKGNQTILLGAALLLAGCALMQEPAPLAVQALRPHTESHRSLLAGPVVLEAAATGGARLLDYEFLCAHQDGEVIRHLSRNSAWHWWPGRSGTYRCQVIAHDQFGSSARSPWSDTLAINRPLIAVMPLQNLSRSPAPLAMLRTELLALLAKKGFHMVADADLQNFMARHRMRKVGGITGPLADNLKAETGAEALLITTLELYDEQPPLRIAMICRLVSLDSSPEILWMDSIGLAGDDSPGLLGLGLIEQPEVLRSKALAGLAQSLEQWLHGATTPSRVAGKFQPKLAYRPRYKAWQDKATVAVSPFFNASDHKYGGQLIALHFLKALHDSGRFRVLEPGVVQKELLRFRIIMEDGISIPQAEAIFSAFYTADYILSGKVFDYRDAKGNWGMPTVDFSVEMLDNTGKDLVWTSKSYNTGADGVYLFDWGRVSTANAMAAAMTKAVTERISND